MSKTDYILDQIEYQIWGFTRGYSKVLETSELRSKPAETVKRLKNFVGLLLDSSDLIASKFDENSDDIKLIVRKIVQLCDVDYYIETYIRSQADTKLLFIEEVLHTNGFIKRLYDKCVEFEGAYTPEDEPYNFKDLLGKLYQVHYSEEDDSYVLLIEEIYRANNKWCYNGAKIDFTTVNGKHFSDGALFKHVGNGVLEDFIRDYNVKFTPSYIRDWLNNHKITKNDLKVLIKQQMDFCYNWYIIERNL